MKVYELKNKKINLYPCDLEIYVFSLARIKLPLCHADYRERQSIYSQCQFSTNGITWVDSITNLRKMYVL